MVRLNRGGRGRGVPRPPILPRAMRPPEPLNRGIPPFIRPMRGGPRGPLLRPGPPHHIRPLPPMGIPPLPPRPFRPPPPPLHPLHGGRPRPLPPPPPPHVRRLPPGPRLPPPPPPLLPPFPPMRGKFRGALRGSRGVKRLGTRTFARAKKEARRKERAEETESNKPWVTETLKAEIHKKFELYKTAREKKTDSDWQAYKEQRVLVGQMTSAAKLEYIGSHPEAGDFFCENCDRGFKTQEKLDTHISEHETCGRDGCTFTAHPKILLNHIKAQHDSGLYNRIVFTENPEDIAKWIAERKRRFPTTENVIQKQAQRNEMMKRGERITSDNKPFKSTPSWKETQEARSSRRNNKQAENKRKRTEEFEKTKVKALRQEDTDSWRGNLPKFLGTAAFENIEVAEEDDKKESNISDDEEWSEPKPSEKTPEKPTVSNILASLMTNYGSDMTDDDDDEEPSTPVQLVTKPSKNLEIVNKPVTPDISSNRLPQETKEHTKTAEDSEESGPEECSVDREDKTGVPLMEVEKQSRSDVNTTRTNQERSKPSLPPNRTYNLRKRRPTLLEKLLQNEIRHERNVILQCVRYVVKNNFLGMAP